MNRQINMHLQTKGQRESQEKFEKEQSEILANIPNEFHGYFRWKSYEEGHAYGYNEVIICLIKLLDGFSYALNKYTNRILSEK